MAEVTMLNPPNLDADGQRIVSADLSTAIAGERNASTATTTGYLAVAEENSASVISKTTEVTIGGGAANDTRLRGIHILAALTGTCVVSGLADTDGTAQSITFPAGSVGWKEMGNVKNSAGALKFTCSNASDDNLVVVVWRAV